MNKKPRKLRRVVIVTDSLDPWNFGGKEERLRSLRVSSQLDINPDFEIIYATMKWWQGEAPENHVAISKLRPMYKGPKRSSWAALRFALASLRVIKLRPDLIEADQIPILPLFSLKLVSMITGAPLSVTWHEVWTPEYWKEYLGRLGSIAAKLERFAMKLPDQIIAVSIPTRTKLLHEGVPVEKIALVHANIDKVGIDGATTSLLGADLLYAGRLIENKRLEIVLQAVAHLRDQDMVISMNIVGDGPEKANLQRIVDILKIGKQIKFVGFLDKNSDVWGLMKKSPIFISASIREGFGFSVAEAHYAGQTIIISDHPENAAIDYLSGQDRVATVTGDDPLKYAEAIEREMKRSQINSNPKIINEPDLYSGYVNSWLTLLDKGQRAS